MPEQPPTLRDMIQAERDKGVSYDELGRRAVDPVTGETASDSLIWKIHKGKQDRMPYAHHLRAIAVALNREPNEVRAAAIDQWLPEDLGADAERTRLLEEAEALLARQKEDAERFDKIRARLDRLGGEGEQRHTA